jgi:hypothetical protein
MAEQCAEASKDSQRDEVKALHDGQASELTALLNEEVESLIECEAKLSKLTDECREANTKVENMQKEQAELDSKIANLDAQLSECKRFSIDLYLKVIFVVKQKKRRRINRELVGSFSIASSFFAFFEFKAK